MSWWVSRGVSGGVSGYVIEVYRLQLASFYARITTRSHHTIHRPYKPPYKRPSLPTYPPTLPCRVLSTSAVCAKGVFPTKSSYIRQPKAQASGNGESNNNSNSVK